MNTLQANLAASLEGFRRDQAQLREDMALNREDAAKRETEAVKRETEAVKRETEAVKREKQQLLAIAGLISLATIVIGLLVRWPA